MKRWSLFVVIALLAVSGTSALLAQDAEATEAADPFEELAAMFDYDQSAPLNVQEVGMEDRDGVTVKDITFDSPVDGEPVAAYLVQPEGHGPFAGVLWVHWYEPSSPTSNRTQYLDEAVTLAKEGVASILPETMWSEPSWFNEGRTLDTDYQASIDQVINLRRALDVLVAQPGVDPARLGYVGHDFGAMYGSIVAGVDHRPIVYVLVAGTKSFSDWYLLGQNDLPEAERTAYIEKMSVLDPTVYIAHSDPAYVYFQFGNEDVYVSHDDASAFFQAANGPKGIARYDAEHDMSAEGIRDVRLSILRWQLGL
jgi:dienelactone hydrolase